MLQFEISILSYALRLDISNVKRGDVLMRIMSVLENICHSGLTLHFTNIDGIAFTYIQNPSEGPCNSLIYNYH